MHIADETLFHLQATSSGSSSTYTLLCNCHWQLIDLNPLRGAPPSQGKARETDCRTSVATLVRNDMQNTIILRTSEN